MSTSRSLVLAGALAMAAAPALAQRHPATPLCKDSYVYTGTVLGQMQMRRHAGKQLRPELTQAAAFWALVEERHRNEVRFVIQQRMRAMGKWGDVEDNLWPLVSGDALTAVQRAELARKGGRVAAGGAVGATLGGVIGAAATGRMDGIWEGAKTGGKVGVGVGTGVALPSRSPGKLAFDIVLGPPLHQALDRLIRHPCTVSAEEALQLVTKR